MSNSVFLIKYGTLQVLRWVLATFATYLFFNLLTLSVLVFGDGPVGTADPFWHAPIYWIQAFASYP